MPYFDFDFLNDSEDNIYYGLITYLNNLDIVQIKEGDVNVIILG